MKIVESTVRQIEITDVRGLDPIRVILSDLGPGRGRINIECWGKSWAAYWGGMGDQTIAQFFLFCNEQYLASYLAPELSAYIFDPDRLSDSLKLDVIRERRRRWISRNEARVKFDEIVEMDFPETVDGLWSISEPMTSILGDDWWLRLPKKPNPDYVYLCRIIKTVQAALLSAKGGAA